MNELEASGRCALICLLVAALESRAAGSTRLFVGQLDRPALATAIEQVWPDSFTAFTKHLHDGLEHLIRALQTDAFAPLIGSEEQRCLFTLREGWLHESNLLAVEQRLAMKIQNILCSDVVVRDLPMQTVDAFKYITDEQRVAVRSALNNRLTLITGGPGTGKTSIIVAIIHAINHLGVSLDSIRLTAPTGKAAFRMDESVRAGLKAVSYADDELPSAVTLHRLLKYHARSGQFQRHHNAPLDAQVVIVDEASMIDTEMMYRLCAALSDHTSVVLLGDVEQLPSVGAGQVYKELIEKCPAQTAKLTKSFRMREDDPAGRAILQFANAIRDGLDTAALMTYQADLGTLTWHGVEHLGEADLRRVCATWHEELFPQKVLATKTHDTSAQSAYEDALSVLSQFQILCVTRDGPSGVEHVNAELHRLHCKRHRLNPRASFQPGEPVIMRRNDYSRSLFNGDQGLVVTIDGSEELWVVFRSSEGPKLEKLSGLIGDLELAYAITIHQSQGSEYDKILICLPTVDVPILNRELVYTGVTRSKRSVLTWGPLNALDIARERTAHRETTLGDLIVDALIDESTP